MKYYNASTFRQNQRAAFNECEKTGEPILVIAAKTKGRDEPQQMVVLSKAEYDKMEYKVTANA